MIIDFLSKTKNPHRPVPMFLIGIFTDEPARLRGFRKAGGDSSVDVVDLMFKRSISLNLVL